MTNVLSARSIQRLQGVDRRLVAIVKRALQLCECDFTVVEGLRTKARQAELYAQGRSAPGKIVTWTLASKHIDGKAVDLAPYIDGAIDWGDRPGGKADFTHFNQIAAAMFAAAKEMGVTIRWGADWDADGQARERGEGDSPHFELAA